MDKFSQLIIEAYRNPNFRFAEETATVDSESEIVAPPMLDYANLFARLQNLDFDKKISVLQNLRRAQTKLKMNYKIDSELPLKLDSTTSVFSDNSLANADNKVNTYFYRVYEYLVTYFENVSNPVPESDSTTKTEPTVDTTVPTDSSSISSSDSVLDDDSSAGRKADTILRFTIDASGVKQTFKIDEPRVVGSNPANLGFKIQSNQLAANHMMFYPVNNGWGVVLNAPIKINGNNFYAGNKYSIHKGDIITIGDISIKIDDILKNDGSESLSSEPLSAESTTYEPLSSTTTDSTPTGSPSKELEGASESGSSSNAQPPITIKVSGKEYSPAKSITLVKRVNFIGSDPNCAIVLDDDSVTDFNCVIQFQNEKWILSKQADSSLAINGKFVDEFFDLNVGDFFVPGTKGTYILSVEKIGTESGGFFGDSGGSGGGFGGFGGRRRSF